MREKKREVGDGDGEGKRRVVRVYQRRTSQVGARTEVQDERGPQ